MDKDSSQYQRAKDEADIERKGANRKGVIKSMMRTSINTSVAQEKAKTRSLIKVVLLDAKSGWRRCQKG